MPPEKLMDLYHAADAFVFPTYSETFGLVAIEAMAAGLPVVASDLAELKTYAQADKNSLLVPAGDVAAFANALNTLISQPALAARIGKAGQDTAREYNWNDITEKYLSLYQSLIEPEVV